MKVYIIKYWATKGVYPLDVKPSTHSPNGYVFATNHACYRPSEYASSPEEAREKVEILRQKKIKSLEKQIQKWREMEVNFQ